MRAWVMVSAKESALDVGKLIRDSLNFDAIEVLGPYDVVVRANVKNLQDLWENYISLINSLPLVGSCTTFLSIFEKTKPIDKIPSAFILIDAAQSEHIEIQEELFKIKEVQKVDIVLGPYDIIVEVVVNSIQDLFQAVRKIIRTSKNILRTVTMVAFPSSNRS
ncbi:MAG: Lrp/AsnC ligand binding domain-containing protein [Nitrososphaerales archaeon]